MEDENKEESVWALAPSIISVLAFLSVNSLLQFFSFFLALSHIVKHVIQKTEIEKKVIPKQTPKLPSDRVTYRPKIRKPKTKRKPRRVPPQPQLKTIRFTKKEYK